MKYAQITENLFGSLGLNVTNIEYLGKGEGSTVLKIETDQGIFTLKTPLYPERKKKILQEIDIRTYFINKGINCIPPPVHSDEKFFGNGAAIYLFVDGKRPDYGIRENIIKAAEIISKIHQVEYEIIEDGFVQIQKIYQFLEQIIKRTTSYYAHLVNSSITSAFQEALQEYEQIIMNNKDKFIIGINARLHGDLSDNSVIDSKGNIWFVDWENSEYGDAVDELCGFLYVNEVSPENQALFLHEYQSGFEASRKISFDEICPIYYTSVPVFDICWGIDQLDMNIRQKLEPERKLRDLRISAHEWKRFYSNRTSTLMIEGIERLINQSRV
jgi:thiamine kinase-like enzyme